MFVYISAKEAFLKSEMAKEISLTSLFLPTLPYKEHLPPPTAVSFWKSKQMYEDVFHFRDQIKLYGCIGSTWC